MNMDKSLKIRVKKQIAKDHSIYIKLENIPGK